MDERLADSTPRYWQERAEAAEAALAALRRSSAASNLNLRQALRDAEAALAAAREELDRLKRQRWSQENRAEVAERGHKAALSRDFAQRDEIKSLREQLAAAQEREQATADFSRRRDEWNERRIEALKVAAALSSRDSGERDE